MSVNISKAFRNVLNDTDFLSKYTGLVILAFCNGLVSYAVLAKNTDLMFPSLVLAVAASIIGFGYDIKYIQNLIADEESPMPEWSGIVEYILNGTKYMGAILLFAIAVGVCILIPTILLAFIVMQIKALIFLIFIPILLLVIIEVYIGIASVGFIYTFIDSNLDMLSLFNIKKVCSYFSLNYFTALFLIGALTIFNGILGSLTTINIRYSLLYIIPLMLAAFFRMGINNLIAQAYRANRDNEKGSDRDMAIAIGICFLLIILFVMLTILLKLVA